VLDDSSQSQEEELSLDAIPTQPAVSMEVPDTPVSYYITAFCSCDPIIDSSRAQSLVVSGIIRVRYDYSYSSI